MHDTPVSVPRHRHLPDLEQRVCDIAARTLQLPRQEVSPDSRLLEDLNCDSLDFFELMFEIEHEFSIPLSQTRNNSEDALEKSLFTRSPFRLRDLAELVYIQQDVPPSASPRQKNGHWLPRATELILNSVRPGRQTTVTPLEPPVTAHVPPPIPFTQLGGRWRPTSLKQGSLFESISKDGPAPIYRRTTDGMRCLLLPAADVEIGSGDAKAETDESPRHRVRLDSFVIDTEPVSTSAYCRFLNTAADREPLPVADWFLQDLQDDRIRHLPIAKTGADWQPLPGTERQPMILVSWYGANAYSLWANGRDWKDFRDSVGNTWHCSLPTEAQWEYAARGPRPQTWPWGNDPPDAEKMRYAQHQHANTYPAGTLPLVETSTRLGMSPFGLHHMAGNVWQWCRDWYAADFYQTGEASAINACNRTPTGVRSERGGSWVGPAELCRSSYRRGRAPAAMGRCLGFRCVSVTEDLPSPEDQV